MEISLWTVSIALAWCVVPTVAALVWVARRRLADRNEPDIFDDKDTWGGI